jgi:hypothetical protein
MKYLGRHNNAILRAQHHVSHEAAEARGHVICENVPVRIVTVVLGAERDGSFVKEPAESLSPG